MNRSAACEVRAANLDAVLEQLANMGVVEPVFLLIRGEGEYRDEGPFTGSGPIDLSGESFDGIDPSDGSRSLLAIDDYLMAVARRDAETDERFGWIQEDGSVATWTLDPRARTVSLRIEEPIQRMKVVFEASDPVPVRA